MRLPKRRDRRSAAVSALLNFLMFLAFADMLGLERVRVALERPSATETVTIERAQRRPHAQAHAHAHAQVAAAAPAPRQVARVPVPVPVPIRVPVPPPHRLVEPRIVQRPLPVPAIVPRPVVPKRTVVASAQQAPAAIAGPGRLSARQIAAIENNLGASIAADRNRDNPLAVRTSVVPTVKHYGLDANPLSTGGLGHHGLCDPVKEWTEGPYDYYYLSCNVRASDGTYDVESVPWPVRFPPDHDPFAGTTHEQLPVALPLPGWHLPAGAYVADGVRQYAADHGVNL